MRVLVKRILRKYGYPPSQNMWDGKAMSVHEFLNVTRRYPPDLQDAAVQTVLQQAEALSAEWAS